MKLSNFKYSIIGALLGAIGGYIYYANVGCVSGTCAITSNPVNSTIYGLITGWLIAGILEPKKENQKES